MPQVVNLGKNSNRLKDLFVIIGEGLCSNIFVIGIRNTVILDAGVGNHANPIWPQLEELRVKPKNLKGIILTHAHHDHTMGAFIMLEKAKLKVYIHGFETKHISSYLGPDLVKVEENDVIETGLWPLEVIHTPGHTQGSICLYNHDNKMLFSGDTVFPDGFFGRYDGESGSLEDLRKSIHKLTNLEVDIMLPGHGRPILDNAGMHIRTAYHNVSRHTKFF